MALIKLTGKKRFRVSFLGKLILQVEYGYTYYDDDPQECSSFLAWRDATTQDITETRNDIPSSAI